MSEQEKYLDNLKEIRTLMEKSTRFLSLSGLSGVFAGIFALFGAMAAYMYFGNSFYYPDTYVTLFETNTSARNEFLFFLFADAGSVLVLALSSGLYFNWRNAKKAGQKLWSKTTKRVLINLLIPLVTGGLFGLILIYHGLVGIVPAITLIFYGLAIINASHFVLHDIRYLGFSEIILGLIAIFFIGYGLFFWMIGFGVLHILYGAVMYFKYEK